MSPFAYAAIPTAGIPSRVIRRGAQDRVRPPLPSGSLDRALCRLMAGLLHHPVRVVACGTFFVAASPALAGPFSYGLGLGTSYVEHTSSLGPPAIFRAREFEPQVRFAGENDRTRVLVEARRRVQFFSNSGLNALPSTTTPIADRAEIYLRRNGAAGGRFDMEGSLLRSHDVLDVDQGTVAVESNVSQVTWRAALNVSRFEGAVQARGWSYGAAGLRGAMARTWRARVLPVRGPMSAWFIGGQRRELVVDARDAVTTSLAVLGYRREFRRGVTAALETGASEVAYADGVRRRGPEAALDLTSEHFGPGALSARLQLERAFPATIEGRLGTRIADGRAWVSGQSLVDVEGGFYRVPAFARRLGAGLEDTLGRATVVGAEASRGSVRPFHVDVPRADIVQASAWIVRRLQPWLNARLASSYLRQTSSEPSGALSFRRVRVEASLTAVRL